MSMVRVITSFSRHCNVCKHGVWRSAKKTRI